MWSKFIVKGYNIFRLDFWQEIENVQIFINIILILIIAIVFSLFFYFKIKNKKETDIPTGFILLIEILIINIQKIVVLSLGKKYKKISSYIFFIIFFINLGNFFAIIGFRSPISDLSVVFSLGFITLMGCFLFGFLFKKLFFIKNLILNPLDLLSLISGFLSISLRLFGNFIAGVMILTLTYYAIIFLMPPGIEFNPFVWIFVLPLHFYFDFFSSVLQSFIFIVLTLTYWSQQKSNIEKK